MPYGLVKLNCYNLKVSLIVIGHFVKTKIMKIFSNCNLIINQFFIFYLQVLERAQKEMLNYNGLGISVMGKFYSLISTFFELYQGPMGLCVHGN